MKLRLYTDAGWMDFPSIRHYMHQKGLPFCFVWGGRGIGKTYGALEAVREDSVSGAGKFIFVRRTQTQVDLISKPELSPFKRLDLDHGYITVCKPVSKYVSAFYNEDDFMLGYTAALSTFSSMRGFDASDVNIIVFDEFIPESHERPIKNESDALLNLYESVNRNREMDGHAPVDLMCFANANNLTNPIFMGLGLVNIAHRMERERRAVWEIKDRGILLINLNNSPISKAKAETALYKLTKNTGFADMALRNDFGTETASTYGSRPLAEYIPVVAVGEICVYQHKANETYYVCGHISGTPDIYGSGDVAVSRFRTAYIWLWRLYMSNQLEFQDIQTEVLFRQYFKG